MSVSLGEMAAVVGAIASIATAIGVALAGWQLMLTQRLATVQFEDQLSSQYRALMRELPISALLGEPLSAEDLRKTLPVFYHYFDLSNEQTFFHLNQRISDTTWEEWKSGIKQNFQRPAFRAAWAEVSKRAPENFGELRGIVPPPG